MNIEDFKDIKIPEGDMLQLIFEHQKNLFWKYKDIEEKFIQRQIPNPPFNMDECLAQLHTKDLFWRITEELGEAANTLKLKPWKQTPMTTDQAHFFEELIDAFHFFIEMLYLVGLDAEALTKLYLQKNAVNNFRIRSKY